MSAIRENGKIVGFQSVRSRPTRDEVAAADAACRGIMEGKGKLIVLLAYTPATARDLRQTAAWVNDVLTSGDLRRRFDLSREDLLGSIARRTDRLVSTIQATLQGVADVNVHVQKSAIQGHTGVEQAHDAAAHQNEATSSAAAAIEQVTVSIGEVHVHPDPADRRQPVRRRRSTSQGAYPIPDLKPTFP